MPETGVEVLLLIKITEKKMYSALIASSQTLSKEEAFSIVTFKDEKTRAERILLHVKSQNHF